MIDFELPKELQLLADEVRAFVESTIVPYERDPRLTAHGPTEDQRTELVGLAREAGLLTIQAPKEYGGRGLTHLEQAAVYEAAGWSTLGPVALNCAAPDEGNMFVLNKVCTPEQAERFLEPVIAGETRSVFAMTEPRRRRLRPGAAEDGGDLRRYDVPDQRTEVADHWRERCRKLDRHGGRPAQRARSVRPHALPHPGGC